MGGPIKATTKREARRAMLDLGLPLLVRPLRGTWRGRIACTKKQFYVIWNCAYRSSGGAGAILEKVG